MAEPVPEIVVRTEIALTGPAEVRGLVPAKAFRHEETYDPLDVVLHRLRLQRKLGAPGVGEPRARLRLELVGGEMVGTERHGLLEVVVQLGGRLPGNAVDEIQRDVVEARLAVDGERAADIVGSRTPFERLEQVGLEGLSAQRDAGDPVLAEHRRQLGRDGLRVRLDGDLGSRRERGKDRRSAAGSV